ncbi:zinc metalloproteinase nas-6-like [Hydractinia symbiolongicarpus]|uniref:zinc metalloproteinase nas-6-like n=1 Tax=Hydractinia symbiolongicarpus TaxID=13093 RepID=UPI00254EBB3C|nr:zinc metalloproteinase nas-6-like [Hydractinia symbiolongicarpus]
MDPDLFEGDMVVDEKQKQEILTNTNSFAAVRGHGRTWPFGIVWYELTPEIANNSEAKKGVMEAIAMFQKYTCVQFNNRWRFPNNLYHGYISFQKGKGGSNAQIETVKLHSSIDIQLAKPFFHCRCSSEVGYKGKGKKHVISLGAGCYYNITVMHQIMHVLGFYHEHNRPDRDNHVKINWNNIEKGYQDKFNKRSIKDVDSRKVPYDLRSIMHCAWNAFGWTLGDLTIETKDPLDKYEIGQRAHLSVSDQYQINKMYYCTQIDNFPTPGPKPYTRPPQECRNLRQDCDYMAQQLNRCKNGWKYTMNYWCKRACGFCKSPPKIKKLIPF